MPIEQILENHEIEAGDFLKESLISITENLEKIDQIINTKTNYRLSKLDRAILRVSINEFYIQKSVPVSVSINEAVENAKIFSTEDSFKLINGILSSVAKEIL